MRIKPILTALAISSLPTFAWGAGCTIDIPVVTATHGPVGYPYWSSTLTVNVTCPAGQAWTLSTTGMTSANPERVTVTTGVSAGSVRMCKPGTAAPNSYTYCEGSTTKLTNLLTLATGTGTGAPQQAATMYVSGRGSCGATNKIYFYSCSIGTYTGITGNFFKVNSAGVDTIAAASFAGTVPQGCAITAGNPSLISFGGTAERTSSFQVRTQCGYDSPVPVVTTIGPGNNPLGETRRAAKAGGGFIAYHLYWDSGYTNEIGAVSNRTSSRLSNTYIDGASSAPYIYLKVPRDDAAHAAQGNGTYTDVIVVSVDY